MRVSFSRSIGTTAAAGICASALGVGVLCTSVPARAFDPDASISQDSGPLDLFRFGFSAYKDGHKSEAAEAYKYAADKGHAGARWALANMYAEGDGVAENDYEAFKIYDEIARVGVEPGSPDTGYFINALMALARYYRRGIPGSPVDADPAQARQVYFQAASVFGYPDAEFELGQMMLDGEGGRQNIAQAKKWLNRSRKSGCARAAALFGKIIYGEGHHVYGLALMSVALDHAHGTDADWIHDLRTKVESSASTDERTSAASLADTMVASADTADNSN
ncbi:tetratricopeptide repeat protein [Pararhizobium mangrovi]|uniref:Sel1 repeat family protein n=1 Tax=Pararhizobium mangrovi TaxID=2590452 RepID=A0A506U9S6_9HYPH|nr:tetratricopeptide repeat protein [Pararhizobium mangrovi]TPW29851.1 sel1 repeat family protein [Pararhizobium mangrovi]